MKKYNLWKSTITNCVYEMPEGWLPEYGGWVLVGSIYR